jgi:hypothetical protein
MTLAGIGPIFGIILYMNDLKARYGQPEKDPRLNSRPSRKAAIIIGGFILLILVVLITRSLVGR